MKTSKTKARTGSSRRVNRLSVCQRFDAMFTASIAPAPAADPIKPIQPEDRYIIDLTDAQIEDLNDALRDEGYEIYFETNRGTNAIASYTLQSLSTMRNRIATTTKLKECWDIARKYAYRSKRPVEGIDA